MSTPARPWYHRPEWVALVVTLAATIVGGATSISRGAAQTAQNTKDIAEVRGQVATLPERLARIEQKVDDLKAMEVRHNGSADR